MRAVSPISISLALALTACGQPDEAARPAEPAPPAAPAAPAVPALHWTVQTTGAGSALIASALDGREALRLACARSPAELVVTVAGFTPVESEEQLSVGVDGEPFMLVADLARAGPGVEARGPIPEDFLKRLEAPREVGVVYGYQKLGPLSPPDAETAERFAAACREAAKG